jgi:deoxycytidylate deaminase
MENGKIISMRYLQGAEETQAISWIQEAAKVAEHALCLKAKCGSVVVKNESIIGSGYNAPPLDDMSNSFCLTPYNHTGKPRYDHTCCMHAEWRAILDTLRKNPDEITGARIYFIRIDGDKNITKCGEPLCTVCSRFALDTGIKEFVVWNEQGVCLYQTDEYNQLSYAYVSPEFR